MCTGSTPKAPTPAAPLPEAPTPPEQPTTAKTGGTAGADSRRRRRATGEQRAGVGNILTGARGVTDGAQTATKSLLGA